MRLISIPDASRKVFLDVSRMVRGIAIFPVVGTLVI